MGLGDSDAWRTNALLCRENNIDGLTLQTISLEMNTKFTECYQI